MSLLREYLMVAKSEFLSVIGSVFSSAAKKVKHKKLVSVMVDKKDASMETMTAIE